MGQARTAIAACATRGARPSPRDWLPRVGWNVVGWYTVGGVAQRCDVGLLGDDDEFDVDAEAAHLFKHPRLGVDDVYEVWASDPLSHPSRPPAHWLMCLMCPEVAGRVLVVPLAPARDSNPRRCRPIGCYEASADLAAQYRKDRCRSDL